MNLKVKKRKILSFITRPRAVPRLLFIFGEQMKIFLMKSERFLSLHWQLCNYLFCAAKSSYRDHKTNPNELNEWVSKTFQKIHDRSWSIYEEKIEFRIVHYQTYIYINIYIYTYLYILNLFII